MTDGLEAGLGYRMRIRTVWGDPASIKQNIADEGKEPALVAVGGRVLGPYDAWCW